MKTWLLIFALGFGTGMAIAQNTYRAAFAQEASKPAETKSTAKPEVKADKPVPTEPVIIRLPSTAPQSMICQPRSSICITCTDTDPCFMYQAVRRPVQQ